METSEIHIVQLFPNDLLGEIQDVPNRFYSVGIHPCQINDYYKPFVERLRFFVLNPSVVAIGEAGLDKLCSTDFDVQKTVFIEMVLLAEQVQKPLIIHCVKAWQEIITLHKTLHPSVPWMIHGFRGKPELAQSLLNQGFYLSYGAKFNPDALRVTPFDRLCIETDESAVAIETLYHKIAFQKHVLFSVVLKRANALFLHLDSDHASPYIDAHTHCRQD